MAMFKFLFGVLLAGTLSVSGRYREEVSICFSQDNKPAVLRAEELVKRYANTSDTTYVINFWATWCGPCVRELPYFEDINKNYINKKVKVILVSLDFMADYDSKLTRFVKRKKIKSEVVLLNETKPNEFIDKINPQWNGSIPATMIINNAMGAVSKEMAPFHLWC